MSKVTDKPVEAVKTKAVRTAATTPPTMTQTIDSGVYRLEAAQALPEFTGEEKVSACTSGFLAFKDADRRTMRTVSVAGTIYKQEI